MAAESIWELMEGTVEASRSYFGEPVCETIIDGDINGDGRVDFTDLWILVSHWTE